MPQKVYLSKLTYNCWINRKKRELKIETLLLIINKYNKTSITYEFEAFWVSLASFDKCRKKFIYRNWPAFVELIEKKSN